MKRMMQFTVAVVLAGACTLRATEVMEPDGVTRLLREAKSEAFQVSEDASTLESYMRQPNLDWRSHASEISHMKEDVNATGRTVGKLTAARSSAAAWQVTAMDRIVPLLQEIAANTTSAIEFLNKNQARPLTMGDYRDYIEANADLSGNLAALIAHFVDYGNTRLRYETAARAVQLKTR